MSATITVEEAQAKLKELIDQLAPGEELVLPSGQPDAPPEPVKHFETRVQDFF